jgi:DNA-binding NtrC family response regulator
MSANRPKLLIVDDGDRHAELAHRFLREYDYATRCELRGPCWSCERRAGCTLTHAHDLAEAREALERHPDVDAVLLDLVFELPAERLAPSDEPDLERRRRLEGLRILEAVRAERGELPVILMTSREELAAEEATLASDEFVALAGADAFDARALGLLVERILAARATVPTGDYFWGRSTAMAHLRRDAAIQARTSLPLLLLGETGTGKSALAERVVHAGAGRPGPFVSVDLAALPATLIAAELFGTARGAFSGAVDRRGRIEVAHGGTLLLDEIGNLPPEAQRMLLTVLEERRVTRLGESQARPVDVKLIAATNADLPSLARAGAFRADLYARLNPAARLTLPPLRDRLADLDELVAGFVRRAFASGSASGRDRALLEEYAQASGVAPTVAVALGKPPSEPSAITFVFGGPALAALRRHRWPGNVRELQQVATNASVFALADALQATRRGATSQARLVPISQTLVRRLLTGDEPSPRSEIALTLAPRPSLRQAARELERQLYERLFDETRGDFAEMARRLTGRASTAAARQVRLRFNQLGLKARGRRKST